MLAIRSDLEWYTDFRVPHDCLQAATRIQCAYWRWLAVKEVLFLRRARVASALIMKNWRIMQEYHKARFLKLVTGKKDKAVVRVRVSSAGPLHITRLQSVD